jgi:multimeric flavodoxin WrbA
MEDNGVETEVIRLVDYTVPYGVYPDMTAHGYEEDERPTIFKKVMDADILVIGSPIRL